MIFDIPNPLHLQRLTNGREQTRRAWRQRNRLASPSLLLRRHFLGDVMGVFSSCCSFAAHCHDDRAMAASHIALQMKDLLPRPCSTAWLRTLATKVCLWCGSQHRPKHFNEGTYTVVTDCDSDLRDRFPLCQHLKGRKQPRLLSPTAE